MRIAIVFLSAFTLIACADLTEDPPQETTEVKQEPKLPREYLAASEVAPMTSTRDLVWAYCEPGDKVLSGSCMYLSTGPLDPFNGTWRPQDTRERQGYFCVTQKREADFPGVVRAFAACTRDLHASLAEGGGT